MSFPREIHRILVIKNRAIGDTILTTGVLRVLRRHRPAHQIHVLVRSPAGELLEGLPYIDRVISINEPVERLERVAYWMRLVRRLREKRYDLVLNFHASFRTALTAKALRAHECVANHHELRGRNWFSDREVPGRGVVKPIIERDLDLLRAIGIEATVDEAMPELALFPAEKRAAAELFKSAEQKGAGPRIFLGVGASRETKRWPVQHYATLARRLAAELDARLVLSTVPGDRQWLDEFWTLTQRENALEGRIRHFSGKTLRQTAAIVSQCDLYVGNDSGLKHLAAALGLKTFTFFGPEAPTEWHPYDLGRHPYAFVDPLPCRTETGKHWCPVATCVKHAQKCMTNLLPDQAFSSIDELLRGARADKACGTNPI